MKLEKLLIFVATAMVAFSACNKDDDSEDTALYMDGTLELNPSFDVYSVQGAEYLIVPGGVSLPETDTTNKVGYYYYLSSSTSVKDTSRIWDVKLPSDTLGSITLYGCAYAAGYYLKSASTTTVLVNDNLNGTGSITGFEILVSDPYIDGPDGRPYYYTTIGGTQWLRQNMADKSKGQAFMNCDVTSYIFGRYYTWEEAMTVCPEGWRLSSNDDWEAVNAAYPKAGDLMADIAFNGNQMWEYWPKVRITDASRLSIMPSGYAIVAEGAYIFQGRNDYASFWTSDEDPLDSRNAYVRYIYEDRNELFIASMDKASYGASVRCVRNQQ